MLAGSLTSPITIERKVETPTDTGGSTVSWVVVSSEWANIRYLNGMETVRADFPVGVAKASIRIWYRTDVDATCRVLHGAKVFDVKVVRPDEAGRVYVDLVCETGQNNG